MKKELALLGAMAALCGSLVGCGSGVSEARAERTREMQINAILNQYYAEQEAQAEENRKNAKQLNAEQQAHLRSMLREAGLQ